jgi:hypothetical protein
MVSSTSRRRCRTVIVALVLPILLAGCTTWYLARPGTLGASRVFVSPDDRSRIWQRAVVVLLDQGYVPQVLNEGAGFISARRREDIADDAFARTIALFSVSPEGLVRLEISGAGLFGSEEKFVAAIRDRQETLLDLILGRSKAPEKPQ